MCVETELMRQRQAINGLQDSVDQLAIANKKQDAAIKNIETDARQILELFRSFQGAFRVLEYIGKLAKPLAAIAGLIAAGIAIWKGAGR